jgi:DNA-binding XRE family transcriptional regulator
MACAALMSQSGLRLTPMSPPLWGNNYVLKLTANGGNAISYGVSRSRTNIGTGTRLVTSAQIRAARGLLDWTVRDLSERAGVSRNTVSNIETGAYAGAPETREAIRRALERAGVEFTNGDAPGVRLRSRS